METRKVQVTGGSTFTLSIPKGWAERNGVSRGDPLFIEEEGDRLTVSCKGGGRDTAVEIDGRSDPEALERRIISAYVDGYSVIRINCSAGEKEDVKRVVNLLMGPEIIEEGTEEVVVEDLLDPFRLDPDRAIERMHLMAKSMHEDAIDAFGDEELAEDVVKRDDEVDRLYLFLYRQFSFLGGREADNHFSYAMCARALERVADHASKIARNVNGREFSSELQDDLKGLSGQMLTLVESAVSSLRGPDPREANDVFSVREELEAKEEEVQKSILDEPKKAAVRESIVLDSIGRSADYATDIAEAAINAALL